MKTGMLHFYDAVHARHTNCFHLLVDFPTGRSLEQCSREKLAAGVRFHETERLGSSHRRVATPVGMADSNRELSMFFFTKKEKKKTDSHPIGNSPFHQVSKPL